MTSPKEKWISRGIIFIFLALITLPYLFAQSTSNGTLVFGGFLLNPIDGTSYLAKMRQGYDGSWLFTLPYTSHPGQATALNLYYLFLGHAAKFLGWSLIFTFHLARVLGALLLALAIYRFFTRVFPESNTRLFAIGLALLGSGLGWLAAAFGLFTSDFWVAEAFPFLASFANAHFPLGMALQVWLIASSLDENPSGMWRGILTPVAAALLSLVYPFGWVAAVAVVGGWVAWSAWMKERWQPATKRWLWMVAGGAPYFLYSIWVIGAHPVLAQWNAQNLTPAPSLMDTIFSFSLVLLLAGWSVIALLRGQGTATGNRIRLLAVWLIVGLLLIYLPINLQRRLISGLYIPIVGLAAFAWQQIQRARWRRILAVLLILFSAITNALIIAGGLRASGDRDPALYVYRDELAAFQWLDANAKGKVVMAAPDSGLLIPAYSSARVIYGHPFETVDAETKLREVTDFYSGNRESLDMLAVEDTAFVFYGPREAEIGSLPSLDGWDIVFEQGPVQILGPSN